MFCIANTLCFRRDSFTLCAYLQRTLRTETNCKVDKLIGVDFPDFRCFRIKLISKWTITKCSLQSNKFNAEDVARRMQVVSLV